MCEKQQKKNHHIQHSLFWAFNAWSSSSFSFTSTILTSCAPCHCFCYLLDASLFYFFFLFCLNSFHVLLISCSLFHSGLPFHVAVSICSLWDMTKSKRQKQKQTLLQFNYECFKERFQSKVKHTHTPHRLMQNSAKQNGTKVKIKTWISTAAKEMTNDYFILFWLESWFTFRFVRFCFLISF